MNENNKTNSNLLNVNQAAELLGVNVGTIRRWARSKVLSGINVGIRGDWRFTKDDLSKMVKQNHKKVNKLFPIVGIGASAGGLEAATQLLKTLPTNLGMGFVLVQHLDPTHESILAKLLSKATTMPVTEAKDNTPVNPNHVYVIPHNKDMTIINGELKLTARHKDNKLHMPIDQFFNSLAESQKEKAIGVVLSGTASDGMLGLKAIKSAGGITFAQDETAKYQGMPKAAIASGYVDLILAPGGIAQELTVMNNHPYNQQHKISQDERELIEDDDGLTNIFSMLNRKTGIDFHHYKGAMTQRRIRRRMLLHKIKTLKDYIEYLKENSSEISSLNDDLLINVTSFFREPQSFQFLNDVVFQRMVKGRSPKDPIRMWVPACATGEEVYSIAISLSEFLADKSLNNPIQIFGTDVSKSAIEKARAGIYLQNEVVDISPERLTRFFEKTDGVYQIDKYIRESCIFAPHNVFADPSFSKLDLVSCCNLLIYLDVVLQDKILRSFHYALKPGGFLMLGKSEVVGSSHELFFQIDKKYKIFSRKDVVVGSMPNFDAILPNLARKEGAISPDTISENTTDLLVIQKEADTLLLNRYTPASVVINNELDVVQFRGSTGAYLEPSPGKPSFNLIKMARGGLGFELRSAISKVKKSGNPFKKENITININANTRQVSIEVLLLKTSTFLEPHYLVLFEDSGSILKAEKLPIKQKVGRSNRQTKDLQIAELEQELTQIREDMRSITEEQEATNGELQSASEEILSSNEELQSINEELETSKEELESTNEELTTVNEELQNRNEQLIEARNYAEAIIRTVQVPLLILDRDLRVKSANRSFQHMFQVNEDETAGKFIYDLGNGQWDIPALRKLLNDILPKNNTFDNYEIGHTFPDIGHKIMILNARKFYKEGENILLAFEDITDRRDIEKQKDIFIGIASHELKTPITTMKAYVQLLKKHVIQKGDKKDMYFIENIHKQTDRLTDLINDLLNTSKIQAGKLVLEKKKFDIDALIVKTVIDFQYTTDTHKIIKEGKIKEQVFGDHNRIEQVLSNLITNAIKYSPTANEVFVRLETDKKNAIVSVQDFGFGIDKRDQAKVFERFYRTNSKKEMNVAGFGLGLYISAEIIKAHQGRIWVESTKGKGSTFYFTLPLEKDD